MNSAGEKNSRCIPSISYDLTRQFPDARSLRIRSNVSRKLVNAIPHAPDWRKHQPELSRKKANAQTGLMRCGEQRGNVNGERAACRQGKAAAGGSIPKRAYGWQCRSGRRRTRKRRGDESGGQDAPRKAGGGGMEKPKSGAAGGASHTKRQGDVFPLHERPGPHGPPDVALPVMGMPQKGIGGTIRNASSSPFSGDALCFIPKAAIRGVGRPPGKGGSLWHSSCLTSWPMYWPASLWRSLSAAFAARK